MKYKPGDDSIKCGVSQHSTINYHHLGNDLHNCLHTNTDHESLGIKLELYCYTGRETKPRRVTYVDNKTPTPKPKRNDLCLSKKVKKIRKKKSIYLELSELKK